MKNLFDIGKSFENEKIHAALFERLRLFEKIRNDFLWLRMASLHAETERSDGAGDQDLAGSGFAGFASDFNAARI